jgi:hypothetical protein
VPGRHHRRCVRQPERRAGFLTGIEEDSARAMTYQADLGSCQVCDMIAREAYSSAGGVVQRIARKLGVAILSGSVYPGADSTEHYAEPRAGIRIARALEQAAAQVTRDYIRRAREAGRGWQEIGAALGAGGRAWREGVGVGEAAFRIAVGYNPGPPGPAVFQWSCPGCGLLVSDQGPGSGRPGHSLRSGFATEGYAQGTPELAVMRHGRWRSSSVMLGYVEEGGLWNDNAAARLGL